MSQDIFDDFYERMMRRTAPAVIVIESSSDEENEESISTAIVIPENRAASTSYPVYLQRNRHDRKARKRSERRMVSIPQRYSRRDALAMHKLDWIRHQAFAPLSSQRMNIFQSISFRSQAPSVVPPPPPLS
ncbi:hypothetical protein Ae201684_006328 [Aphanomyces euteiches]|uniref:Uncharacterized protein n=1 Tax=Aphanomyces euteiches TaxID=100861 RepID=A0A6G0XC10_9STRA|nr:hypothetical protein Ae201684_006328 [Aphanomyces euteiches]